MATSARCADEWVKRINAALKEFQLTNFNHDNSTDEDRSSIWRDELFLGDQLPTTTAAEIRRATLHVEEEELEQSSLKVEALTVDQTSSNCLVDSCRGGSGKVRVGEFKVGGGRHRDVGKSFAPERPSNKVKWYSDGQGYYRDAAAAIKQAKKEIMITDWFFSPELMLTREVGKEPADRLMELLKQKAHQEGVAVRVLIYAEIESALANMAARVVSVLQEGNEDPDALAKIEVNSNSILLHNSRAYVL